MNQQEPRSKSRHGAAALRVFRIGLLVAGFMPGFAAYAHSVANCHGLGCAARAGSNPTAGIGSGGLSASVGAGGTVLTSPDGVSWAAG